MVWASLLLLFTSWSGLALEDIGQIWSNNTAVEMQAKERKIESYEEFAKLLGEEPFNPLFQFNMGTAFLVTEDIEKSKKCFKSCKKTRAPRGLSLSECILT